MVQIFFISSSHGYSRYLINEPIPSTTIVLYLHLPHVNVACDPKFCFHSSMICFQLTVAFEILSHNDYVSWHLHDWRIWVLWAGNYILTTSFRDWHVWSITRSISACTYFKERGRSCNYLFSISVEFFLIRPLCLLLMTSFSFPFNLPTSLTCYNLDLAYFSNVKTNNIEIMCHILGNITFKAK